MSLINQMLMDLDRRAETANSPPGGATVLQGLRPSPGAEVESATLNIKWLIALTLLLVGAGIAGYVSWSQMSQMESLAKANEEGPLSASLTMPLTPAPINRRTVPSIPPSEPTPVPPLVVSPPTVAEPSPAFVVEETKVVEIVPSPRPLPAAILPRSEPLPVPPTPTPTPIPLAPAPKIAVPVDAQALYQQGVHALAQEQLNDAQDLFLAAVEASPTHVNAHKALVELALRGKDMGLLRQRLEAGASLWTQQPSLRVFAARLYVEAGDEQAALKLLTFGSASEAKEADLLGLRAVVYQRLGRHPQALQDFSAALELKPSESRWWMGLALSAEASADTATATQAYQRVIHMGAEKRLIDYARQRLAALTTP